MRHRAWAQVEVWLVRWGGVLLGLFAFAVTAAIVWVLYRWLVLTVSDAGKLDRLVSGALHTGLVALATLAAQRLWPNND